TAYGLISEYEKSIIQSIVHNTQDSATHAAISCLSSGFSLKDLIDVNIARQVAEKATVSSQIHFWNGGYYDGIALDYAGGHELRDHVARGFMVLFQLSRCQAAARHAASNTTTMDRIKFFIAGIPTPAQKAQELILVQLWSRYTDSLPQNLIVDLLIMTAYVAGKVAFDSSVSFTKSRKTPIWTNLKAKESSAKWAWFIIFLLRQGPVFIKKLWSEDERIASAQTKTLRKIINHRSAKLVALERATADGLHPKPRDEGDEAHQAASAYYISIYYRPNRRHSLNMPRKVQWRFRRLDAGYGF
ncbi:MAG: hypothetical protein Q9218_006491, partial [Villophora microphyllina]